MKKVIYLCLILLCLACKIEKDDLMGLCENSIELSENNLEIPSEGEVKTITVSREFWWIAEITLNGKNISVLEKIDRKGFFQIEEDAFIIEREGLKGFTIEMKPNKSKENRILTLVIQSGNCFSYLSITQSGEK